MGWQEQLRIAAAAATNRCSDKLLFIFNLVALQIDTTGT
jgi:hypothetical protein